MDRMHGKILLLIALFALANCKREKQISASPLLCERCKHAIDNKQEQHTGTLEKLGRMPKESEVAALSDDALTKLLDTLKDDKKSKSKQWKFRCAIKELARRNPEAALAFFSPKEIKSDEVGLVDLVEGIATSKPELLFQWLQDHATEFKNDAALRIIYFACMVFPSSSHIDLALQMYDYADHTLNLKEDAKSDYLIHIFSAYGKQDYVAAEKAARSRLSGRLLEYALYNLTLGLEDSDPNTAITLAQKMNDQHDRSNILGHTLLNMLEDNNTVAIEKLSQLSSRDLQGALSCDSHDAFDTKPCAIVSSLAETNPEALSKLLDKVIFNSNSLPIFATAITALSEKHPEKISELLNSLPESDVKNQLIGKQFEILTRSNSDEAIKQAATLQNYDTKNTAYENIARIIGSSNLENILQATEKIPQENRSAFLSNALEQVIPRDTKKAAEFLLDTKQVANMDPQSINSLYYVTGRMLSISGDKNFEKNWLNQLPEEQQENAMRGIANYMIKNDINGFSKYISDFPKGKMKEAGVRVLIDELKKSDPEMAKQWEESIKQ